MAPNEVFSGPFTVNLGLMWKPLNSQWTWLFVFKNVAFFHECGIFISMVSSFNLASSVNEHTECSNGRIIESCILGKYTLQMTSLLHHVRVPQPNVKTPRFTIIVAFLGMSIQMSLYFTSCLLVNDHKYLAQIQHIPGTAGSEGYSIRNS